MIYFSSHEIYSKINKENDDEISLSLQLMRYLGANQYVWFIVMVKLITSHLGYRYQKIGMSGYLEASPQLQRPTITQTLNS